MTDSSERIQIDTKLLVSNPINNSSASPMKKEKKDIVRDSILDFEIKISNNDQLDMTDIELDLYWLAWPIAFILWTAFCIVIIVTLPLADPALGLGSNIMYILLHIGILQMILFTAIQLFGSMLSSSFLGQTIANLYSPIRIILRILCSAFVSVTFYMIISASLNIFPIPLSFLFSIGGMIVSIVLELIFLAILSSCCRSIVNNNNNKSGINSDAIANGDDEDNYLSENIIHDDYNRNTKHLRLIAIFLIAYIIGWGFAIIFINLYSTFNLYLQYIFIFLLMSWKTALPMMLPKIMRKFIKDENSSSILEGFVSSSIHMYWTLIGTLCFSSMTVDVFIWYLIMDMLSAINSGSKGSRHIAKWKDDAIYKGKICCGQFCRMKTDKIQHDSELILMHERAYYTAVFIINSLGEILIPFCIAGVYYFSTLTPNYQINSNFLNFFTYCMIMSISDSIVLLLVWLLYRKKYSRNILHPISYIVKQNVLIPFTLTCTFMVPLLMMLPIHSGIVIE